MPGRDLIVVGASAGGVEALKELVRGLPADLPAAVCVVLHIPAHGTSVLPNILTRSGPLPAMHPRDGQELVPGRIYIAPPDHHLLVRRGQMRLSRGPRENGHRPAVDPLYRSAALAYGPRVLGVVLSGSLDDGTAGMEAIRQRGGVTIVQDPAEALYPGMVRSVLETVEVDHCLPIAEISALLARRAAEEVPDGGDPAMSDEMERESEIAAFEADELHHPDRPGTPSGFACPDCGGSLFELTEGELIRFRCRVGHAWAAHSLLAQQSEEVETALWSALRALEERAALCEQVARRMGRRGHTDRSARRFQEQAAEARNRAAVLRQVLISQPTTNEDLPPDTNSVPREGGTSANG
jgi:two-component system chemotaxis response regulator CheB